MSDLMNSRAIVKNEIEKLEKLLQKKISGAKRANLEWLLKGWVKKLDEIEDRIRNEKDE